MSMDVGVGGFSLIMEAVILWWMGPLFNQVSPIGITESLFQGSMQTSKTHKTKYTVSTGITVFPVWKMESMIRCVVNGSVPEARPFRLEPMTSEECVSGAGTHIPVIETAMQVGQSTVKYVHDCSDDHLLKKVARCQNSLKLSTNPVFLALVWAWSHS